MNNFNATTAANIERSTDVPRLEEMVRECRRAIRHSARTIKYSKCPERIEAATQSLAGYIAKCEAAENRLTVLGC